MRAVFERKEVFRMKIGFSHFNMRREVSIFIRYQRRLGGWIIIEMEVCCAAAVKTRPTEIRISGKRQVFAV